VGGLIRQEHGQPTAFLVGRIDPSAQVVDRALGLLALPLPLFTKNLDLPFKSPV
jgi:hypothetical protein